jgi:hypothetical protein
VSYRGNEIDIQVHGDTYRSAREMASKIRRQVSRAQTTTATVKQQGRTIPTKERYLITRNALAEVSPTLASVYDTNLDHRVSKALGAAYYERGKEAESLAKQVLEQARYLDGNREITITQTTGVDVAGRNRAGNNVFVEVKASDQNSDFADLLDTKSYEEYSSDGKGCRQSSDEWFRAVADKKGVDIDLEQATILGVHINPSRQTVTIYRRIDAAATRWKPLMTKPLSKFDLETG